MSEPLVSVCMPVWNGQAFLDGAIRSVLNQTYRNIELIIIDDCSTDESVGIIESFADQRIKFLQNESRAGLFQNYNRCLEVAGGEFIKPMAQDDLLTERCVESLLNLLEQHPETVMAITPRTNIDQSGQVLISAENLAPGILNGTDVIMRCLKSYANLIGEPVCALFRKDPEAFFDPAYTSLGDLDLWFRLLRKGKLGVASESTASFRKHDESTTARSVKDFDFLPDYILIAQRNRDILAAGGLDLDSYLEECMAVLAAYVVECEVDHEKFEDYKLAAYYSFMRLGRLYKENYLLNLKYEGMLNSRAWRATYPIRRAKEFLAGVQKTPNRKFIIK